jgi:two-component system, LytTR family, sensor kinase
MKALYFKYQYFFNLIIVAFVFAITRTLDWLAWIQPYPGKMKNILLGQLFEFISYFPVILLLVYTYLWTIKRNRTILFVFLIIVFSIFCPTFIRLLARALEIFFRRNDIPEITFDSIKKFTPGGISVMLTLSATLYLTRIRLQYVKQQEATFKAQTLAKDVQLKMLRYQINPHFLFNVLNSIHALIDENKDKAKKLIVEMSEFYRYTLNNKEQTASLEKEVEAVQKYLEIQKTRFEEKFEFEISVDDAANAVLIPSFVIHLLIENAVKYGIKSNEQKLIIRLEAKIKNKSLLINVSNTGNLIDSSTNKGTGNGLENIKNRLELYYNENATFSLTEENGWVFATIEIKNLVING